MSTEHGRFFYDPPAQCEACDNTDSEYPFCDGCDCCVECCNCAESDCDCEVCIARRENDNEHEGGSDS